MKKITSLFRNYKRYFGVAVLILLLFIIIAPQFATAATEAEAAALPTGKVTQCSLWGSWSGCPAYAAAVTANFVLWVVSLLLWLVSVLFSLSIGYSLSAEAFKADVIATGWAAARDAANLFFIFIMLAISIATILRRESYGAKTLLPRLIIVALLVNFSMPFTKAIIDVGNVLAITFYDATGAETLTSIKINGTSVVIKDVSTPLLKNLKISQIGFDKSSKAAQEAASNPMDDNKPLMGIFMSALLSSILILILTFILAAAGVLFLLRAIILWILIILSPMAFLFMVLPKTQGYATQWWEKLFQQTFFAPAFMFFFYLTIKATAGVGDKLTYDPSGVFTELLTGNVTNALTKSYDAITFFFSYAVIATFALASIVVAQKLGAMGASTAISWGQGAYKGALGFAGKHTVGRAASAVDQKWGEKLRAASPTVGGWAVDQFKRVGGDYKKSADAKVGAVAAMKDAGRQAQAMSNLNEAERTAAWKKLNPQQKAGLQSVAAQDKTKDQTYAKMITGLATKDETARQKAAGERAGIAVVKEAQKQSTAQGYQDPKMVQSLIDQMASINVSSSLGEVDVPAIQKLAEELAVLGKDLTTVEKTFTAYGSTNAATIIQNILPGNRALINAALGAQIPKGEYKDKGAKPDTTGTPQP